MKFLTDTIAYTTTEEETIPSAFEPLANFSLIIMVGLTAVGKSTIM